MSSYNHQRTHSAPVTIERVTRWGWRPHDQPPWWMIPLCRCPDPGPDPGPGPYHYRYAGPYPVLAFGCERKTNFDQQLLWTRQVLTQFLYWIVLKLLEWREWKELRHYQIDIWMGFNDKWRQGGRETVTRREGRERRWRSETITYIPMLCTALYMTQKCECDLYWLCHYLPSIEQSSNICTLLCCYLCCLW